MNKKGKDIIKKALLSAFDKKIELSVIASYFDPNYEQFVDDDFIKKNDFIKHLQKVRVLTKDLKIEFLQLIEENNIVFSRHRVTSNLVDGTISVFIVFAEFHLNKENKICKCIETTRLIKGNKEHQNLGSDR